MKIFLILILLVLVAFSVWVWRAYRKNIRKLRFMLNAFRDSDFNFHYPEKGVSANDREVNRTLNQINALIAQASRDAREREKYYELILNSVNTGIMVIDEKGNVLQTNKEAMRLLGLPVFTHMGQLTRIDEQAAKTLMQLSPGEKQQVTYHHAQTNLQLSVRVSGTTLANKAVRIIAIGDINNELDAQELESWSRLTRVLTHEIMNTITPIHSLSETLLHKSEQADGELKDGLQAIHTTSAELMHFVESYRTFSQLPTPSPTLFYVGEFCERMKQLALHPYPDTPIQIKIEATPPDLIVLADEGLISRVMLNLLKNAIQAIGADHKGEISIHAYCTEEEAVVIDVSNDGPLIPADIAEHIFIPFFTTKKDGSGIGLSISRQIMRLSGGTLTLHTDTEKGITTFRLIFS